MSCGVGQRRGSDLALLRLWCRPASTAPMRTLAWERPYAVGAALEKAKKKKTKKKTKALYFCRRTQVLPVSDEQASEQVHEKKE